jgi:hypothetical protein
MTARKDNRDQPGCLGMILGWLGLSHRALRSAGQVEGLPYRMRDDFLSPAEHSFYLVLRQMMGEYFTVCPKVNLVDLFYVAQPHVNFAARARIDRKHVDFLICDPRTMQPRFAIELDDASHRRKDRAERDKLVDHVFARAGLPLLRIPARASYSQTELGSLFRAVLSPGQPGAAPPSDRRDVSTPEDGIPACPKCGAAMALRQARRGSQRGERFYGCVNYPRCRGILPYP